MRLFIIVVAIIGLIALGYAVAMLTVQQNRRRKNIIAEMERRHAERMAEMEEQVRYHAGLAGAARRAKHRLEQTNDPVADVIRDFQRERDATPSEPTHHDRRPPA